MTSPAVMTSTQRLLADILGLGANLNQTGKAVGVNGSYLGRVAKGERGASGAAYDDRLRQLKRSLQARQKAGKPVKRGEVFKPRTAPVATRTDKAGRPVPKRGARLFDSTNGTTTRAGTTATRNGARGLAAEIAYAFRKGWQCAVDLHCTWELYSKASGSGSKRTKPQLVAKSLYVLTVGGMAPADWLEVIGEHDGNVIHAALSILIEIGELEGGDTLETMALDVVTAEVRTWNRVQK